MNLPAVADQPPTTWTAGVVLMGDAPAAPHDEPQHWLTQIRTYDDGATNRHVSASHYSNAADAQADRIRRLRENGIPFKQGPGWI